MRSLLGRFLSKHRPAGRGRAESAVPATPNALDVPVYPPADGGLPAIGVERITASQQQAIQRLLDAFGFYPAEAVQLAHPLIEAIASYTHLLPLTQTGAYRGAGGLFRYSLDVARHAIQLADASAIEADTTMNRRRRMEPLWRYAVLVAGLSRGLHHLVLTEAVTAPDGELWQPVIESLAAFCARLNIDRYQLSWRTLQENSSGVGEDRSATGLILPRLLPEASLRHLSEEPEVLTATLAAASGHGPMLDLFARTVEKAHSAALRVDLEQNATYQGTPTVGSHPQPYIIAAMRECVQSGRWPVNTDRAKIWYAKEGAYVVWPPAANELRDAAVGQGVPIPTDASAIAELLLQYRLIERGPDTLYPWRWRIKVRGKSYKCLKLSSSAVLFDEETAQPQPVEVSMPQAQPPVTAPETSVGKGESTDDADDQTDSAEKNPPPDPAPEQSSAPAPQPTSHADPAATSSESTNESQPPPAAERITTAEARDGSSEAQGAEAAPGQTKATRQRQASTKPGDSQSDSGASTKPTETDRIARDLEAMESPVGEVMTAIGEDIRAGRAEELTAWTDDGLALALGLIGNYGIPAEQVQTELLQRGWLWVDPMRPDHPRKRVKFAKKQLVAVTVVPEKAKGLLNHAGATA